MGLILVPSEVKNLVQTMKNSINSKMEQYSDADEALRNYINDEELDCEAWRASKETMHVCYQSIIGGMRVVQDSILSDLDTVEGSIGDECLDEDEIEAKIQMLEAECQQYENCIAMWNSISSNFPNAGFSLGVGGLTEKYEGMIQSTKAEIEELQKKLDFLYEVEAETAHLFEETENLLQLVSAAIHDGGVTVNGEGKYSELNWLGELTIAEQNLDNIEMTNSTLCRKVGEPINGWLQLYDGSSVETVGRVVAIPDEVVENKWAMKENLEQINPYALKAIEGENDVIIGKYGELIDKEGRYWVAVGPRVMNEEHRIDESCIASEMQYGTKIDVVVCDNKGNEYYIPCIVGDCKNHTYPNGIYQTGYSFPNGEEFASNNVDGSIIEFCGKGSIVGLSDYSIEKIIVYDFE